MKINYIFFINCYFKDYELFHMFYSIKYLSRINDTQVYDYLEWIPFEKFEMVKYIGKGRFSSVYSALWMV